MEPQEIQKPAVPVYSGKASRTWIWIGLAALPIVVIAVALTVWLRSADSSTTSQKAIDSAAAVQSDLITIGLTSAGPSPGATTVKKGQAVTWENQDSRQHRLTADQSILPGFDSGDPLANGDTYTFTFEQAGTFHYYDPADPTGFSGTVTVE